MNSEEFTRLMAQFESCKGREIHRTIGELRSSFEGTTQNYFLLKNALVRIAHLDRAIWLADNNHPERMEAFFLEVRRDFNGYLPSVRALTDYMERLMSEELSDELKKEFGRRAEESLWSPLGCFFRGLANYILHHQGLPTGIVMRGAHGKPDESYANLDAERILEWKWWDEGGPCARKGKSYLQNLGKEVRILEKLEEYHELITGFYIWFHNELIRIHQAELDELYALRAKLESREG